MFDWTEFDFEVITIEDNESTKKKGLVYSAEQIVKGIFLDYGNGVAIRAPVVVASASPEFKDPAGKYPVMEEVRAELLHMNKTLKKYLVVRGNELLFIIPNKNG